MKMVRFPMFFEVCGYQTLVLPDEINADDESAVREFISDSWEHIKLPKEYDYVGDNGFDYESDIEIYDASEPSEREKLEEKLTRYLYKRQGLIPELLGTEHWCVCGGKRLFDDMFGTALKNVPTERIKSFLDKYYRRRT